MKYYWIASTIEIKTAVLPCRENNAKNCVIVADFKSFYVICIYLLIIFTIIFGHPNPGPGHNILRFHSICYVFVYV